MNQVAHDTFREVFHDGPFVIPEDAPAWLRGENAATPVAAEPKLAWSNPDDFPGSTVERRRKSFRYEDLQRVPHVPPAPVSRWRNLMVYASLCLGCVMVWTFTVVGAIAVWHVMRHCWVNGFAGMEVVRDLRARLEL